MDLQTYLNRIKFTGELAPSYPVLAQLQDAHLQTVPFENLDIHLGRKITLDRSRIFTKLMSNNRGGFCYEQNGLFSWLLETIGFDITLLSARVYDEEKQKLGIEFDHLAIMVTLDGVQWLVDVGFGHSFAMPLRIQTEAIQDAGDTKYQIVQDGDFLMLRIKEGGGDWFDRYQFSLIPRKYQDFAGGCHYHQTSPNTSFTQGMLCSIAKPNGRITLTDDKLIITNNGDRSETAVLDNNHFSQLLKQHFSINLTWD